MKKNCTDLRNIRNFSIVDLNGFDSTGENGSCNVGITSIGMRELERILKLTDDRGARPS